MYWWVMLQTWQFWWAGVLVKLCMDSQPALLGEHVSDCTQMFIDGNEQCWVCDQKWRSCWQLCWPRLKSERAPAACTHQGENLGEMSRRWCCLSCSLVFVSWRPTQSFGETLGLTGILLVNSMLYVTPFVYLHARFLSCKPLERYETSSLHHLCLEIWNFFLFSVAFFYLRLLHTHKRCYHGDNETSECPLWARGAFKLTLGQHIYCKWKEKIWCGIQHRAWWSCYIFCFLEDCPLNQNNNNGKKSEGSPNQQTPFSIPICCARAHREQNKGDKWSK